MSPPKKAKGRSKGATKKAPTKSPKKSMPAAHFFQSSSESAAVEDSGQLHSPWLPLIWMLVPLGACLIYGMLTRHGH